jgi:flagellin-specific chaperone FliS
MNAAGSTMYQRKSRQTNSMAQNSYLSKEIMEAPQEKLLIKTYDFALLHCKKGDVSKTNRAIDVLLSGLDLKYEIAQDLYKLYMFCKESMVKGEIEIVYTILSNLKETWITAINKAAIAV